MPNKRALLHRSPGPPETSDPTEPAPKVRGGPPIWVVCGKCGTEEMAGWSEASDVEKKEASFHCPLCKNPVIPSGPVLKVTFHKGTDKEIRIAQETCAV